MAIRVENNVAIALVCSPSKSLWILLSTTTSSEVFLAWSKAKNKKQPKEVSLYLYAAARVLTSTDVLVCKALTKRKKLPTTTGVCDQNGHITLAPAPSLRDPCGHHEQGACWFNNNILRALDGFGVDYESGQRPVSFGGSTTTVLDNGRIKQSDGQVASRLGNHEWKPTLVWEVAVWNETLEELLQETYEWTSGHSGANVCLGVKIVLQNNVPVQILLCNKNKGEAVQLIDISPQINFQPNQIVLRIPLQAILDYRDISRFERRTVNLDMYWFRQHIMTV